MDCLYGSPVSLRGSGTVELVVLFRLGAGTSRPPKA
jgi:hypothetical protein